MPNQQPNQQFNQPYHPIIPSPKPKINLKYILIVAILAFLVGGGILAYQYWWLPKQETKPPEVTKDETASWQTYRNEEYGFELKYPSSWIVAQETDSLKILSLILARDTDYAKYKNDFDNKLMVPLMSQIEIITLNRNWTSVKDMDINAYLEIPIGNFEVSLKELKKENINGIDYYFYKREVKSGASEEDNHLQTGAVWNDKNARYDLFTFRASTSNGLEEIIKEMAKSFKIIEWDETANWQTYQNEEYGFEIKYPIGAKADEEFLKQGFIDFPGIDNKDMVIRVSFYGNSRNDKTLQQLFEIRDGVSNLIPANFEDYSQIKINGIDALKKINTVPDGKRIGATIIILGSSYYYLIETGDQYTPFFDQTQESLFDAFVSTFKFIPR